MKNAPRSQGPLTGLIRWVRKNQSNKFVQNVIKPMGSAMMRPIWEKRAKAFFQSLVKPGDVVFDIGAHKGDKAESFLQCGAKTVVCFEPQPDLAAIVKDRFKNNSSVKVVAKGLAAQPGVMKMYVDPNTPQVATLSKEWTEQAFSEAHYDKEIDVEITTLDAAIEEFGKPNFAKIDVEGFELEVLKGLSQAVPLISVEFNKRVLDKTLATIDYLKGLGYKEYNLSLGDTAQFVYESWISADELVTFLKQPVEQTLWAFGDVYARTS